MATHGVPVCLDSVATLPFSAAIFSSMARNGSVALNGAVPSDRPMQSRCPLSVTGTSWPKHGLGCGLAGDG